ncbi:MAG TPA: ABC transporter permease [Candidatus Dormibacteraeota bacterium]|nr:ABC transporter permease [Candidatus Dormibacteraeota bacterium]
MTELHDNNRAMFWRILRRLLGANRGRLFVMLLALGAGAAVTAALLNLQVDAKRRLTAEFRAFGPNVLITPRQPDPTEMSEATLDESVLKEVSPFHNEAGIVRANMYLYLIADVTSTASGEPRRVVIGGTHGLGADDLPEAARIDLQSPDKLLCIVGGNVATQMHLHVGDRLTMSNDGVQESCKIGLVRLSGNAEDNQILPHLDVAQRLAGFPGRISLVQISVPGTAQQIDRYIKDLQRRIPDARVRPVRQFTEGEAKIYNRISGLLTATVGIVLLLTALCVMAAMTNVAIERKMDVGLMKAIGGATRRVVRLFLAEAALLGLAGGLIGAALGILLSIGLGKAVFGVAARPRLVVYPVAVGLTMLVSILSAFPLRRLASIRPASVFRGEA